MKFFLGFCILILVLSLGYFARNFVKFMDDAKKRRGDENLEGGVDSDDFQDLDFFD